MLRVLPSGHRVPHIQGVFYFKKSYIRDIRKVVTSFMQDGIYPTRNFATFGPSEYSRRLPSFYIMLSYLFQENLFHLSPHGNLSTLFQYSLCFCVTSGVFKASKDAPLSLFCFWRLEHLYIGSFYPKQILPKHPSTAAETVFLSI